MKSPIVRAVQLANRTPLTGLTYLRRNLVPALGLEECSQVEFKSIYLFRGSGLMKISMCFMVNIETCEGEMSMVS